MGTPWFRWFRELANCLVRGCPQLSGTPWGHLPPTDPERVSPNPPPRRGGLGTHSVRRRCGPPMTTPTPEQIAETIAALDRLGVPVTASRADAQHSLRTAGESTATDRVRAGLNERKRRAGITPRDQEVSKPKRAKWSPAESARRAQAVAAALVGIYDERLRGAACVGRHELFDAELDHEPASARSGRHGAAQAICARCPVIASCRQVASEHHESIAGVWAGELRNAAGKPGRPRKESA